VVVKQDCPTGLARCVTGAVEVSTGRVACSGCPCAWTRTVVCERGCAIEDVELVREASEAKTLCKGLPGPATVPPIDAGATTPCPDESDRFWCRGGTVHACPGRGPAVPVSVCTFGCAADDETLAQPSIDVATATAVMCRHDRAVTGP